MRRKRKVNNKVKQPKSHQREIDLIVERRKQKRIKRIRKLSSEKIKVMRRKRKVQNKARKQKSHQRKIDLIVDATKLRTNRKRNNKKKGNKKKHNRNEKSKNKNNGRKKIKTKKKKRKNNNGNKKTEARQTDATCSDTQVSEQCLVDAQLALVFEANQVKNYLKQAKRQKSHAKISGKKKGKDKTGRFAKAAGMLLMAIGGNMSSPKCGNPEANSSVDEAQKAEDMNFLMSNYTQMMNCSAYIEEICTIPNKTFNATIEAEVAACNLTMYAFIDTAKVCYELQRNVSNTTATELCTCWAKSAALVDGMRKCKTKTKADMITNQKKRCSQAFTKCKKMEDGSVRMINQCMNDHSMKFINQTGKTLEDAALANIKMPSNDLKEGGINFFDNTTSARDAAVADARSKEPDHDDGDPILGFFSL